MAAASAAALHDELLLDIFSRLPDPIDVLRCAATCGPWFRVILAATAAGNLNLPQPHRSSFIAGAFYPVKSPGPAPASFSCFLPNSDGLLLFRSSSSSYAANGKPLASRRGLLLSRLTPTPLDQRKLHLAVSHPLLAARARLLPPPPFELDPELHRDLTGYALLTTDAGGFFRVLVTAVVFGSGDHHRLVHRAYSYSSATGLWSAPLECPTGALAMSGPRAGAVDDARGTAHWLYRNASSFYVLSVAGDAVHAALTKLPMIQVQRSHFQLQQTLFPCLTTGGELALLHIYNCRRDDDAGAGERGAVDLWVKKAYDHGGSSWARSETPAYREAEPLEPVKVLGFAESAGKLLVCGVETWTLWWLDVESGETEYLEQVSHDQCYYPPLVCGRSACQGYDSCSECTYNSRVIYEVHYPSLLRHISAWS